MWDKLNYLVRSWLCARRARAWLAWHERMRVQTLYGRVPAKL